jgi:hypothetical protein
MDCQRSYRLAAMRINPLRRWAYCCNALQESNLRAIAHHLEMGPRHVHASAV